MTDLIKNLQSKFGLVAESSLMHQVIAKVQQVAPTKINVLLRGESGVGKDVMAKVIHGLSERKDNRIVIVNCGAIPEGIIESELFGHEKGSFTGAEEKRQGYFEIADGGTIFLDEIGDTPKNVQVKLLRILENGEFYRVGSSEVRRTDVRIITATNRDLWQDVEDGKFREDLYYRLDTVTVNIPPLRERPEDVIPIFRKFVTEFAAKYDSVFQGFADDARNLLISYRWPGNIRELRNVAEQLVVLEKSQFVTAETLKKYLKGRQRQGAADNLPMVFSGKRYSDSKHDPENDRELMYRALLELRNEIGDIKKMLGSYIYSTMSKNDTGAKPFGLLKPVEAEDDHKSDFVSYGSEIPLGVSQPFKKVEKEVHHQEYEVEDHDDITRFFNEREEIPSIEEAEKFLIQKALTKFDGNRRKAADTLGMSERTLYRKIDQYNLA